MPDQFNVNQPDVVNLRLQLLNVKTFVTLQSDL